MPNIKEDPVNASMFKIDFGNGLEGYFQSVSGGGGEVETILTKENGEKGIVIQRAIPGNFKHTALELKRGLTSSMALWTWFKKIEEGKIADARVTGSLVAIGQDGKEVARWSVADAWPSKLGFPQLDAKSNDIGIETMTLQHTGMVRTS
jgi:phage tail-like protein